MIPQKKMAYNVAVVGATGAVGKTFLDILSERKFPIDNLKLLASSKSAGKKMQYNGKEYTVEELTHDSFKNIDIALFSAGASRSKEFAPSAVKAGAVVVDNSSAFRMDNDVPLVVPEVNPEDALKNNGIIANPNCTTIIMLVPLKPLHDYAKIKRVVVSSYQSASGAGAAATMELMEQTKAWSTGEPIEVKAFAHQLLFNVIPHIDVFTENGYTKEEMKMINETRKILHRPDLKITATTVRVPVKNSHSESINVEFENDFEMNELLETLKGFPNLVLVDDPASNLYPMAINANGHDEVFVGRVRRDESVPFGVNLWVVADNIRKGAASNAVQIVEKLIFDVH